LSSVTRTSWGITALSAPGFRRYAAVQLSSGLAVSSQRLAELWLVLEITGAGLSLGTTAALRTAPSLVLTGLGGWLADRIDRKILLSCTQAARGAIGGVFALVTWNGLPHIGTVYVLVFALGCVGAIDQPVRRALVRDVVEPDVLASAASMHTATLSVARMIGPLAAGALLATSGMSAAFVFGVVASGMAILFVQSIRLVPVADPETPDQDERSGSARATMSRIWSPELRSTYLLLAVFSVLGWNLDVVIPLVADSVLGGGAVTYAVLVACLGIGSLTGSLFTAARASTANITHRLTMALLSFSAGLAVMAVTAHPVVVAVGGIVSGVFGGVFLSLASASVQTNADRWVQGRQAALYSFVFVGGRAFGAPATGGVADWLGPRGAIIGLAIASVLGVGVVRAGLAVDRRRHEIAVS
jgi:MFS family permease